MVSRATSLDPRRWAAREGKLTLFLGFAPGVGKTYAMLRSARARREEGVDVVVGWVDTHHRAEADALIEGMERLPPRAIEQDGARTEELDRELALQRHPGLLLVDDLARSNPEGALHRHRWEDVVDLLHAGIDVDSTVNVQNIESLSDVVAQVTGVVEPELVPDSVISRADEIEIVDVPPDELLKRFREGKIGGDEQSQRAMAAFLRTGNLFALRELALRHAAERVDEQMRRFRREHGISATWDVTERIAVTVGPSPSSADVIHAARRMAGRMTGPWYAVFVETPVFSRLPREDQERVGRHLALVERLGGTAVRLRGKSVAEELLRFAKQENITQIVVGKPTHPRWRDFVYGSLLDDLTRSSGRIGIYAIQGEEPEGARRKA